MNSTYSTVIERKQYEYVEATDHEPSMTTGSAQTVSMRDSIHLLHANLIQSY